MESNHVIALDWVNRKKSASTDGSIKSTKVNSKGKVLTYGIVSITSKFQRQCRKGKTFRFPVSSGFRALLLPVEGISMFTLELSSKAGTI